MTNLVTKINANDIWNDQNGHILLFTGVKPLMSNNIYKETICIVFFICLYKSMSFNKSLENGSHHYIFLNQE